MVSSIEGHRVLSRSPHVLSTEVGGEVALMNIPNGRYYALDAVGSAIWRKLEQPVAMGQLATALTAEYNGDPVRIEKDLRDTLEEWRAWRLISVTPLPGR